MQDQSVARRGFGETHFSAAQLGDQRRTKRLVALADELAKHPGGTLPDKLKNPAELRALYRLMDTDRVTHASVLEPHMTHTVKRMRAYAGTVLILHDTTELDYTGLKSLAGALGQIGNGSHRGYLCHNSLAVAAESREVLGLAQQILFHRPDTPPGESRQPRRRRAARESRLWKRGSQAIPVAPTGRRWVDIADRGGDLLEFLDYEEAQGKKYVVRSKHDRWVLPGHADDTERVKLHDFMRSVPAGGERVVDVPARAGQPARRATVGVAWAAVRVVPPRQPRGEYRDAPLAVWAIRVWELDPPEGVNEPLEWILLTNVPVATFEEATERVDWYTLRWIVEEYHKAMKTGCGIEQMQFTQEDRLQPAIALVSVLATTLLQLRDASRRPDGHERLAREWVPALYVTVLSVWRYKEPRPHLTVYEFYYALARLGGHQNRKHDHPPGWLVLWRGWTQLQAMVDGALAVGGA